MTYLYDFYLFKYLITTNLKFDDIITFLWIVWKFIWLFSIFIFIGIEDELLNYSFQVPQIMFHEKQ